MSPEPITTDLVFVRVFKQYLNWQECYSDWMKGTCPKDVDPLLWKAQGEMYHSLMTQWREALDEYAKAQP